MKMRPTVILSVLALSFGAVNAQAQLNSRGGAQQDFSDPQFVKAEAFKIDKFIGDGFRQYNVSPMPMATDQQYVRRVYLDIVGRIPTYEETTAFLEDQDPNKRPRLVNTLLDSPGYNSHTYNYWADVLRATSRFFNNQTNAASYIIWLKGAIENNMPYDEFVKALLGSSGGGWAEGNGAVGYYERDKGMPLDNMANTMRIFLGTRMECAQCHNHPFAKWEQMDFFETAAFTAGIEEEKGYEERRKLGMMYRNGGPRSEMYALLRMIDYSIWRYGIKGGGTGQIELPMDYKYSDGDPGEMVGAKAPFGQSLRFSDKREADDARYEFAEWLTSQENPRFGLMIANRLWKRAMGFGLYEPLDNVDLMFDADPDSKRDPSHPELWKHLANLIAKVNWDQKAFLRILYNTRTYQLGPNPKAHDPGLPYAFNGRLLQRMSAEQIWDSMLALTIPAPDERESIYNRDWIQLRGQYVLVGQKTMSDLYQDTIGLTADQVESYARDLMGQISSANSIPVNYNGGGDSMMMGGGGSGGITSAAGIDDSQWKGFSPSLVRASELPSPAPASHFLRRFGQSDREVIENGSRESDVTQVLSLINGHVQQNIVGNQDAVIYKTIADVDSPGDIVKRLYLAILNREPTDEELVILAQHYDEVDTEEKAREDFIWTLLNTSEFLFVQ